MKVAYVANNGKVFNYIEDAEKEDRFISEVEIILSKFTDISIKHGEFVQRNKEQVDSLIEKTYRLLARYYGNNSEITQRWRENPRGIVGRFLCDGNSPAYPIYTVILSIDNEYRQWDQPYYANKSNKG